MAINLDTLNHEQKAAVTYDRGHLLTLAGAGSGKTRVLVYRIVWLLEHDCAPNQIFAVTFTNKAALEMKHRLESMLELNLPNLWIGTFHGLAHRLLRIHAASAGLPPNFQIIDSDDQTKLLKQIHKAMNLDHARWPVKNSLNYIANRKEEGERASTLNPTNFLEGTLVKVYTAYEKICTESGLVDFAELLLKAYELLADPSVQNLYHERFKHLLIDEFQDTNTIQYRFLTRLRGPSAFFTVVGDDDQSIYGWRGANSTNMQKLTKDYPDIKIIRLEQNYRSTGNILKAANQVIQHNHSRLGKKLWTSSPAGELISLYNAFNEIDEARHIAAEIKRAIQNGLSPKEVAVLYRSNAQSRILEEKLIEAKIAYHIYGGVRFFERAEIKDVLAYLRLAINPHDNAAFARVLNLPPRGIGDATLNTLQTAALELNCSLWEAVKRLCEQAELSSKTTSNLDVFRSLITSFTQTISGQELPKALELIINASGLREYYRRPQFHEYQQSKLENLDELISAAKQFTLLMPSNDPNTLAQEFLAQVSLNAGEEINDEPYTDCVNLMTLHAAKGLEFPLVFICGLEEGLFPHILSVQDNDSLEEERRLCYVGMTRAKNKLSLSYASARQIKGVNNFCRPSRFLKEIPPDLIKLTASIQNSLANPRSSNYTRPSQYGMSRDGLKIGQTVLHPQFGEGLIISFEGDGDYGLVKIRFKRYGEKLLSPKYAHLKLL